MNTVVIELCAEDRARLDAILNALQEASPRCDNCVRLVKDLCDLEATPEEDTPKKVEEPKPNVKAPEPEDFPQPDESPFPAVTIEDIRSKVLALTGAGKKNEVREIVTAYAAKVGDIPEDKRAEVLEKLTALEG